MTCNFVEGNGQQVIPNINQKRMVKFGDFKHNDVNESLSLPTLCDVVSIGEGLIKEDGGQVDHFDDWGWTFVTHRKRRKASLHKDLTKRHIREKMIRRFQ
ncbi:hypothetical protein H5410_002139 [Solanum commersonii]|uniref:Uncharacterized protein n=1 Tax=Solanum commersonii TaxID=4109 RepID=A0A9J6B117_SOLCO|nr:hypothetical protein H5410_002139 [Solanum commersonii]